MSNDSSRNGPGQDSDSRYALILNFPESQCPPNHYVLLGLREFESDKLKIQKNASRLFERLQDMSTGSEHVVEIQELLNEVSKARVILLDDDKRAAYDRSLREPRVQRSNLEEGGTKQTQDSSLSRQTNLSQSKPASKKTGSAKSKKKPVRKSKKRKSKNSIAGILSGVFCVAIIFIAVKMLWDRLEVMDSENSENVAQTEAGARPKELPKLPIAEAISKEMNLDDSGTPGKSNSATSASSKQSAPKKRNRKTNRAPQASAGKLVELEFGAEDFVGTGKLAVAPPILRIVASKDREGIFLQPGDVVEIEYKSIAAKGDPKFDPEKNGNRRSILVCYQPGSDLKKRSWFGHDCGMAYWGDLTRGSHRVRSFGKDQLVVKWPEKPSAILPSFNVNLKLTLPANFGKPGVEVKADLLISHPNSNSKKSVPVKFRMPPGVSDLTIHLVGNNPVIRPMKDGVIRYPNR